ncbi:ribosome silencing factor [Cruoricaptor ignavus]|uniref:ribosome silencing factor n=1 Tax=Cruoricaptor ignavus TaxID=1118202 RepID=UPI00370DBC9F
MTKSAEKQRLISTITEAIQDVKGEEIRILDLSGIENAVAETFIICSGNSNTQVAAISAAIQRRVRNEAGERPWHVEGEENAMWILMDYVSVVVHIFLKQIREYYDIEELWGDAKITAIAD